MDFDLKKEEYMHVFILDPFYFENGDIGPLGSWDHFFFPLKMLDRNYKRYSRTIQVPPDEFKGQPGQMEIFKFK